MAPPTAAPISVSGTPSLAATQVQALESSLTPLFPSASTSETSAAPPGFTFTMYQEADGRPALRFHRGLSHRHPFPGLFISARLQPLLLTQNPEESGSNAGQILALICSKPSRDSLRLKSMLMVLYRRHRWPLPHLQFSPLLSYSLCPSYTGLLTGP